MKSISKVAPMKYVDQATIHSKLETIKQNFSIGDSQDMHWKNNDEAFILHGYLNDANYDAVEAIFAADKEAALLDVSNEEVGAKLHREIKAIESCIDSVTDANVKQSLQCILNYIKLLHGE